MSLLDRTPPTVGEKNVWGEESQVLGVQKPFLTQRTESQSTGGVVTPNQPKD